MLVADLAQGRHEALGRHVEPALALDRLDDDGGHPTRLHVGLEQPGKGREALLFADSMMFDGERRVVDVAREGPELGLIGQDLAGQAHGQQGAAVEGAVEGDHGAAPGIGAGDLDRVLHRLGAGIHEQRLGVRDRHQAVQALGQFDIAVIGHDLEGGVGEALFLRGHGGHHLGVAVAGVEHGDAAGEVHVAAAVDVPDLRVVRPVGERAGHGGDAPRHRRFAPLPKFGIARHAYGSFTSLPAAAVVSPATLAARSYSQ